MNLILASTSPYRARQLTSARIQFQVAAPRVNEEQLKTLAPRESIEMAQFLALKKAESLREKFPAAIIIGGDQIAELGGERLDKPGDKKNAALQLKRLQGRTHRLITSIALLSPLKSVVKTNVTELSMRPLTDPEIEAYIQLDRPFDCAGAYKIESAGIVLMEKIVSEDPSAIQGLPLMSLATGLRELGLPLTGIWSN